MSREVLLTRLELLHRNATEVESVLDALEQAREGVMQTRDDVTKAVLGGLGTIKLHKEQVQEVSDRLRERDPAAQAAFDEVVDVARALEKRLDRLTATLKAARMQFDAAANRQVRFDEGWQQPVGAATSALKGMIKDLQGKARAGKTSVADLWKTYHEKIAPKADQLFAEYLDLIGGVAIRELGLRIGALKEVCHLDELCGLADWHARYELRLCVGWKENDPALILPARDMRADIDWPIVRFGFGYWSIWGMPLEGHEFGKVVAGQDSAPLNEFADDKAELGLRGLRTLIADVIAAWAEGPAYACALYFLALAPNDRVVDPETGLAITAADRSRVVRACLRHQIVADRRNQTPEAVNAGYGYLEFVNEIDAGWAEALGAAGVSPSERESLDDLPERVVAAFELSKPFTINDWRHSTTIWGNLAAKTALPASPATSIRHLMNAAWYARLAPDAKPKTTDAEIEQLTLRQGMEIVRPRDKHPPRQDGSGAQP
jgi:hypothetical protein